MVSPWHNGTPAGRNRRRRPPVFVFDVVDYNCHTANSPSRREHIRMLRSNGVTVYESNGTPAIGAWNRSSLWVSWYVSVVDTHSV